MNATEAVLLVNQDSQSCLKESQLGQSDPEEDMHSKFPERPLVLSSVCFSDRTLCYAIKTSLSGLWQVQFVSCYIQSIAKEGIWTGTNGCIPGWACSLTWIFPNVSGKPRRTPYSRPPTCSPPAYSSSMTLLLACPLTYVIKKINQSHRKK